MASEQNFGDLLRTHRRKAKLTQGQLAARCHYTASALSRWERNERLPRSRGAVDALRTALDLDPTATNRLLLAAGLAPAGAPQQSDDSHVVQTIAAIEQQLSRIAHLLTDERNLLTPNHQAVRPLVDSLLLSLTMWGYIDEFTHNLQEKKAIARFAATRIWKSCNIILDSGTSITMLAQSITENRMTLGKVLTNNFLAAIALLAHANDIELAGGKVSATSADNSYGAITGTLAESACTDFREVDLAFLGTTGITFEDGPFASDIDDRRWKRRVIDHTAGNEKTVYLLADASKLGKRADMARRVYTNRTDWEDVRQKVHIITAGKPDDPSNVAQWEKCIQLFGRQVDQIEVPG